MLKILPKIPREKHWEALKELPEEELMTPEEFLRYWNITQAEFALITHQTIDQVKKVWSGRTPPSYEVKRRLARVNKLWNRLY